MRKGFTLVELMVVIAILGIIAAVVIPSIAKKMNGGLTIEQASQYEAAQKEQEQLEADQVLFGAWRKATGNPKRLDFDEWRSLKQNGLLPTAAE